MRIALVNPARKKWPKGDWLRDAVGRLGHRIRTVRTIDQLRDADVQADICLFGQKNAGLNVADLLAVAENHQSFWRQLWGDLVATDPNRLLSDQELMRAFRVVMAAMDEVRVRERGLLAEYKALGINAAWWDQGCPSDMPACQHHATPEHDVCLWGVATYKQRKADVRALVAAGFQVLWAAPPCGRIPKGVTHVPFTPPHDLPKLVSRAAVVLAVDLRHDLDGYWSDRLWLALGMGACVVRRHTPGLPLATPVHSYWNRGRLIEHVRRLVGDPDARRKAGENGRAYVMGSHTYEHRLKELLCD